MGKKWNKFKDGVKAFKDAWQEDEDKNNNGLNDDLEEYLVSEEDEEVEVEESDKDSTDADYERDNWKAGISVEKVEIIGGSILVAAVLLFGGLSLKSCRKSDEDKEEKYTTEMPVYEEDTAEEYSEEVTEESNVNSYANMVDLLNNANINSDKKEVLSAVWDYLSYYNENVANDNMDSESTAKLACTWDEAMAQYLVNNNLSDDVIRNTFDGYDLKTEEFVEAYQSSYRNDLEAAHVITGFTGKDALLNSEQKSLYNEYEDLIVFFNRQDNVIEDYDSKQSAVDSFYTKVKEDFVDGNKDDSLLWPVLPLINTMDTMSKGIQSDAKLTKADSKKVHKRKASEEKLTEIFNKISSLADGTDLNEEFTYSEIKEFAINELINNNAYDIENRYIVSYKKYQESLSPVTPEVTEENTDDTLTIDDSANEYIEEATEAKKNKKKSKKEEKSTELGDDDISDKIPDWMLEDETTESKKKDKKKKQQETQEIQEQPEQQEETTTEPFIDEEVPEVEKDTPDYSYNDFQEYCDLVATMIVENMAKEQVIEKSREFVKTI